MKKMILLTGLLITTLNIHGLEIDEKLTCRFLKLSNSKKTVLINRGAEDGLAVGDHAKFFITSGIIARGMVEKVSPSRSIWSLYRVVSPDDLVENKVLNLKIASPVKVTNDPSKSLKDEGEIEVATDKIETEKVDKATPVTAEDKDAAPSEKMNDEDQKELEEMGLKNKKEKETKKSKSKMEVSAVEPEMETVSIGGSLSNKSWEVFSMLSLNSMSGTSETTTTSNTTTSISTSASVMDIALGIERYFFTSGFMKNVSLFGVLYKRSMEEGDRLKTTNSWFQYGGGLNYHFYNNGDQKNKFVLFGEGSFGMGTISITEKYVTSSTEQITPTDGKNNFFSVGVGAKYYISNFGIRALFDYNIVKETFTYSDGSTNYRNMTGPRMQFGLSYRF